MSGGVESSGLKDIKCENPIVVYAVKNFGADSKTAVQIAQYVTIQAQELFKKWSEGTLRQIHENNRKEAADDYEIIKRLKTSWSPQDANLLQQRLLARITNKPYEKTLVPVQI